MGASTRVLFLDAADDVLVRRYEATPAQAPARRSTTASPTASPTSAQLLEELKGRGRHRRRHRRAQRARAARPAARAVRRRPASPARCRPASCRSATSTGCPLDVDLVFDCRFLPNPHWVDELRPLTGHRSAASATTCCSRPRPAPFLDELDRLFALLLPAYEREGKSYLSIGVGCTGGRHRSVVDRRPSSRDSSSRHGVSPRRAPPGRRPWRLTCADASSRSAAATAWPIALRADPPRTPARITAVVSVADDGGSSGRLRRDLGVPAPGRPPRAASSRSPTTTSVWAAAFEHRFARR